MEGEDVFASGAATPSATGPAGGGATSALSQAPSIAAR